MVMDFSKLSDDELLSMYNSSQPTYGVDRQSIMGDQSLNSMLPNRAIIQDFIDKQIYTKAPAPAVNTKKQVANKQPVDTIATEEIITEPIPNVGQWNGTVTDSITNFANGSVQPNATQQQFQYETPEARQDYINKIEQFANNYPALLEQDRRRQMQAALLAPVINNDRFVNAAIGQGQVDTKAKQLELLNTAANARVSEAQRPLLAQAFANAGMPAELAYASEDQLKSIVNLLVAKTNMDSSRYKADVAAQTDRYVADVKALASLRDIEAKYGEDAAAIAALRSGMYDDDQLRKMFPNFWQKISGASAGAPVKVKRDVSEDYNVGKIKFADEKE